MSTRTASSPASSKKDSLKGTLPWTCSTTRRSEVQRTRTAISSNVPWLPYPVFGGYPHYAASKGAVNALIVEAAKELKRFNIMVNGVAPGGMSTPGATQNMCAGNLTEEQEEEMYDEIGI